MFKQTTILTILALAAYAIAADVTIPAQTGAITGATAKVGPIVLSDANSAYSVKVPFEVKVGTGTAQIGIDSEVIVATTGDGCTGVEGINTQAAFTLRVPQTLKTALTAMCLIVDCPDYTKIIDNELEVDFFLDMKALKPPYANVELKLSDIAPVQAKTALKFLGTDATITLMLQNFTTFKKGMEVPISYTIEVMKKSIMEFPTAVCGTEKGAFPCKSTACPQIPITGGNNCAPVVGSPSCCACAAYCSAVGTAMDLASGSVSTTAVYDKTEDLIKVFKTIATAAKATIPSQVSTCKGASGLECISVGDTATQCPAGAHYTVPAAPTEAPDSSGAAAIAQHAATLLAVAAIIAHNLW